MSLAAAVSVPCFGRRREVHARWTTPALARLWCRASGAAPSYCCVCCCACCFKPAKRRRCRCSLSPGTAGSSAAAACSPAHRELLYVSQRLALRADHPAPSTAASKATQLTALSPWPKNQRSEPPLRTCARSVAKGKEKPATRRHNRAQNSHANESY